MSDPAARVTALDWEALASQLDDEGYALTPPLLDAATCRSLEASYDDPATRFRSTIDMARFNFGRGQYRYFDYPLPPVVEALRGALYPPLARIANAWARRLGGEADWPEQLERLLSRCHAEGQQRPTPLMLRYGAGDYNCLHQDLYGPIHFPLQVVVLLSEPGRDFEGGELILVEQRPRMQSRPMIPRLAQGTAAIIPVRERPRRGARGYHRVQLRHGVGRVVRGSRTTLGLIFHDAA
ncbi:MAG: 2OG-Fe(II) oxygenase [Woeseiaceae bacterium]